VVAQNWQNLLAEESNSSFDVRNQVTGKLPLRAALWPRRTLHHHRVAFGACLERHLGFRHLHCSPAARPLTPHYEATVNEVARGTTASLRPDLVPGAFLSPLAAARSTTGSTRAPSRPPPTPTEPPPATPFPGRAQVSVNASLSKTIRFSETRTFETRATASNVFNTVQYSGVDTTLGSGTYGEVTSVRRYASIYLPNARFRF
jgi:hypothetical protein